MKITLLGVGGSAGLPQIGGPDGHGDWGRTDPTEPRNRRSRASIIFQTSELKNILVDTGPDLRSQLTACGIGRVDAVVFTHAHADHIAGLDEIRILNRILGAPLPGYATPAVWAELKQRFDYAFKPFAGGFYIRPVLQENLITPYEAFDIAGVKILPLDQDHGFSRSLGLRLGDAAYCTDVVRFDDAALQALAGVKTLIIDCFTLAAGHPTHAGLPTVLAWVAQLRPTRTILTHMGPDMDYAALRAMLPAGVEPGYDGMVLDITAS